MFNFHSRLIMGLALSMGLGLMAADVADEAPPSAAIELATGRAKPAIGAEASAADVLRACQAMLPARPVELKGSLILRNRRGIVKSEYDYRLVMRRTDEISLLTIRLFARETTNCLASVTISRRPGTPATIHLFRAGAAKEEIIQSPLERVLNTDVTWLDLAFDFLWWKNAVYEAEREGESVHGQICRVILVRPDAPIAGLSAVRLWVDKKTGCMMQAEEVDASGKPIRRLWGTRVKKFDGRWMASVLEVETLGSRQRTKITVDSLKDVEP